MNNVIYRTIKCSNKWDGNEFKLFTLVWRQNSIFKLHTVFWNLLYQPGKFSALISVRILFHLWVIYNTTVMRRDSRFGAGIVWGTIPIVFPISWVAVPGCSRNGYGTSPNLWVQKKFVKLRQSTQDTRLRPTEFFWEFFSYSPFDLFRNLGNVFLSHFWIKCVLRLTVPGIFRRISQTAAIFLLFLEVAMILRETSVSSEDWIGVFIFQPKVIISSYEGKMLSINANS